MSESTPKSNIAVEIKIDPDAFTIDDMALVMSLSEVNTSQVLPKLVEMMNRVVIGGVGHLPATKLNACVAEVIRQWGEAANPKVSAV